MNLLLACHKPPNIGSNQYLSILKKLLGEKKAGFAGTLDPFASGLLIVAFGQYTRLLPFLDFAPLDFENPNSEVLNFQNLNSQKPLDLKSPNLQNLNSEISNSENFHQNSCQNSQNAKIYRAVLWLGLESASLDCENVQRVENIKEFSSFEIQNACEFLHTHIAQNTPLEYFPPIFSAKKINGVRAYDLARKITKAHKISESKTLDSQNLPLKKIKSHIFDFKILHYCHPFLSFEISTSRGAYIRSIGALIAQNLGVRGALCSLHRIQECGVNLENLQNLENAQNFQNLNSVNSQKSQHFINHHGCKYPFYELDAQAVLSHILRLNLPQNEQNLQKDIENGKKIALNHTKNGVYRICFDDFFSIIGVQNGEIKYLLNRMAYADTIQKGR